MPVGKRPVEPAQIFPCRINLAVAGQAHVDGQSEVVSLRLADGEHASRVTDASRKRVGVDACQHKLTGQTRFDTGERNRDRNGRIGPDDQQPDITTEAGPSLGSCLGAHGEAEGARCTVYACYRIDDNRSAMQRAGPQLHGHDWIETQLKAYGAGH
jgi:hypothetical protein